MIPTLTLPVAMLLSEEALQNRHERLLLAIAYADLAGAAPILLSQPAGGQLLPQRIDAVEYRYFARCNGRDKIREIEVFQSRRNDLLGNSLMNPFLDDSVIRDQRAIEREPLNAIIEQRGEERRNPCAAASDGTNPRDVHIGAGGEKIDRADQVG